MLKNLTTFLKRWIIQFILITALFRSKKIDFLLKLFFDRRYLVSCRMDYQVSQILVFQLLDRFDFDMSE